MKHKMRLNDKPFELIKNGTKTIELRLNDEKRSFIEIGNIIEFTNRITDEKIYTKVIDLHKYNSFEELYKHIDKRLLGYKENEIANFKDMELYYSKEEQDKYGVLGIELELLGNCKNIIYNDDNLKIQDINRIVKRSKILFENSNEELIICFSHNNYFLLGGHVEDNEDDMECLHREVLEETGVNMEFDLLNPFISIRYYNKDYPSDGTNSLTIANYYFLKCDLEVVKAKQMLTSDEVDGGFKLEYIKKDDVIEVLEKSLEVSTRKGVVLDTIKVVREYLKK